MFMLISVFVLVEVVGEAWKSSEFPSWMPIFGPLCGIHMSLAWGGSWPSNSIVLFVFLVAFGFVLCSQSKWAHYAYWAIWFGYGVIWAIGYT